VGLIFQRRVNKIEEWVRPVSVETQVLREGLRLIETEPFRSAKLRQLANRIRHSAEAVRSLELLLSALNERRKEWFYTPSLLLLLGTQLCMAIERWRGEHGESMKVWLRSWAEFEALNSLAAYTHENPENGFPEVTQGDANFEAQDLGHPLLQRADCVVNDVELNRKTRFYVISGSNMSGKSTLLRAIGVNAVLASAGAPVRASALRMSRLSVCASMSVVDSLMNAKSRFLAEVDRLRQTIDAATNRPVLFLVDEIFSGTNSRDRRIAAEAVLRTLVDRGAIGALSTHDLALAEIPAEAEQLGINVHMGARDGGGPMDFDYRLKTGVTTESNALAIARMAGVPV
jgi:DNA mismatch repair ATPase MutS